MSAEVLILTRREVAALMTPADYRAAVERAFRAEKAGRAAAPPPMHVAGDGGVFHAKAAALRDGRPVVALKLNGNFPGNPARGLPTIQGAIFFCDAENGRLLAILDSIEITLGRTAGASALAAAHLAREDAKTLLIVGCGDQARPQTLALADVRRFTRARAFDLDAEKAARFADDMQKRLGVPFEAARELRAAAKASDVIVTTTTARAPFLAAADVSPGAFIAAVGADNPDKNEIAADLMASAKVVVDVLEQCLVMGDLRAAIAAGAMTAEGVHADLGDIVTGRRPGRRSADEIFVFDSTGTGLEDVAAAALAYERAGAAGAGRMIALGAA